MFHSFVFCYYFEITLVSVLIFVVAGEADKELKLFASACHIGGPNFVNSSKSLLVPRFVAWQRNEKMAKHDKISNTFWSF